MNFINSEWKTIDMRYLAQLHQMHRTDATISACSRFLRSRLLGLSLIILSDDTKHLPTQEFYEFVLDKWGTFAQNAMSQLIVQGFAAYVIHPGEKGSFAYPVCQPFGRGKYMVKYNKYGEPQMGYLPNQNEDQYIMKDIEPDKKTLFVVLDYPDVDGKVVSAVSSAYSIQAFKRQLEANTVYADRICARPPILTTNKTNDTFDNRDLMGLTGTDTGAAYERHNLLLRNQMNMDIWNQQTSLMSALNSSNIDTASTAWQSRLDPITGLPMMSMDDQNNYIPQFIPMPSDSAVANYQLPRRPTDFVPIMDQIINMTCICMGMSPDTLLHGAARSRNNSFMDDQLLQYSIMRYRSALVKSIKNIYAVIFDLDRKKEDTPDIKVVFPSLHNPETIMRLYSSGLITYDVFVTELTHFFGFTKESFLSEEEHQLFKMNNQATQQPSKKTADEQNKSMAF